MKLRACWIGPLILFPLGCTSRHDDGSASRAAAHRETMEDGDDDHESEESEKMEANERIGAHHEEHPASSEHHEGAAGAPRSTTALGFDQDAVGSLPAGWKIEGTNQQGPLATWKVIGDPTAPSGPNVLALTSPNHDSGGTFNLCWTDKVRFRDGSIELSMKPVSGKEDQGGGLIWRAKGKDDYYICRANPLESNLRVYYVKDGSRHQLGSAKVEIATGKWHVLRVEQEGDHIACSLDGKQLLDVRDSTHPNEGGIGLWTKADAASEFDDLKVTAGASGGHDEDERSGKR